jgi:hypothetical protein
MNGSMLKQLEVQTRNRADLSGAGAEHLLPGQWE